eukprot:4850266-Prymnesium_polylepis.1
MDTSTWLIDVACLMSHASCLHASLALATSVRIAHWPLLMRQWEAATGVPACAIRMTQVDTPYLRLYELRVVGSVSVPTPTEYRTAVQ